MLWSTISRNKAKQKLTDGGLIHALDSCWHVADTQRPAILGLLACMKLCVVMLNCVLRVEKPAPKIKPVVKPTKSTEDLIEMHPE